MSYYLLGQVAPFELPYDIDNKYIWQKTYSFDAERRVIVKFDSNNCFDKLFLINSKGEFSGPYNTQMINETNPFKAKQLTIQVSYIGDCKVDDRSFIIEDHQDSVKQSSIPKIYSDISLISC